MSTFTTVTAMLEAHAGERLVFGTTFEPPRSHATFYGLRRLGQRVAGRGGLATQFARSNNYIAVSATRVLVWRGPIEPVLLATWPREAVTGTAIRKHWAGPSETRMHEKLILRATLRTPDGEVVIDLDAAQGGRRMLRTLGIEVPRPDARAGK